MEVAPLIDKNKRRYEDNKILKEVYVMTELKAALIT